MLYIETTQLIEAIANKRKSLSWGACSAQVTMENNCKSAAYDEVLDIIRSLQKKLWKPTEEQLKALQMVKDSHCFMYQQERRAVETLLKQLKSL